MALGVFLGGQRAESILKHASEQEGMDAFKKPPC